MPTATLSPRTTGSILAAYVSSEETVLIDVGSSFGLGLLNWARTHEVYAFEPQRTQARMHAVSRCLNPQLAARVHTINTGLGDRYERCELYQYEQESAAADLTHVACGQNETELVAARASLIPDTVRRQLWDNAPLDRVLPRKLFARRKVVKIDAISPSQVLKVIRGARRFLTSGKPPAAVLACVHYHGEAKVFSPAIFALMTKYGYRSEWIDWWSLHPEVYAMDNDRRVIFVRRGVPWSAEVAAMRRGRSGDWLRPIAAAAPLPASEVT